MKKIFKIKFIKEEDCVQKFVIIKIDIITGVIWEENE